jgi:hypothetical protein
LQQQLCGSAAVVASLAEAVAALLQGVGGGGSGQLSSSMFFLTKLETIYGYKTINI